jgi:hypothetical protein
MPCSPMSEWNYSSTYYNLGIRWVGGQLQVLAALPPGKQLVLAIEREAVRVQCRSGRFRDDRYMKQYHLKVVGSVEGITSADL